MSPSGGGPVVIEAPGRLHFGVLDLRGDLGRRFGGIGAAIPSPSLLLDVALAEPPLVTAEGPDAERAVAFARRFLDRAGIAGGARIRVRRAMPAHAGLGSGTQLALAVARGLAELYGGPRAAADLARIVQRGRRSAIGTWAFELGGFILEGGRREGADEVAPLLARYPVPASWCYVAVVPNAAPGLSGEAEADAFRRLPPPPAAEVETVSHLVLMQLLPALVEEELAAFGAALSEIQRITGGWFAPAQGGVFAPGPTRELIPLLAAAGAPGVGQSSWGPTAYAVLEGAQAARALAARAEQWIGGRGRVFHGSFQNTGADVRLQPA
ncbi:MAG TPA: beta-ribofuranosylaminobenzene 5'-phosphate synthase family protein [Gemmatimonadales bacterium]|nr:beta-ribofuranosylaminobenzene 5'-phosphate synthase family protein [Gemmatimonadales bacterium]